MSRSDMFLGALGGIQGSMSSNFCCSICDKEGVLEYTLHEKVYWALDCCGSLVCKNCTLTSESVLQRCRVCSSVSAEVLEFCKNSYRHIVEIKWKKVYAIYETWNLLIRRMGHMLVPFCSKVYLGSWCQIVEIEQNGNQDQKRVFTLQYRRFLHDVLQSKSMFYTFHSLRCLPFVKTQRMLEFFCDMKCSTGQHFDYYLKYKMLLRVYHIGIIKMLGKKFSDKKVVTKLGEEVQNNLFRRVLSNRFKQ